MLQFCSDGGKIGTDLKKVSDSKVSGNVLTGKILTGKIPRAACLGADSGSAEELSRQEEGISRWHAECGIQFFGHE